MPGLPRRVSKPWGHELVWADATGYQAKFLFVQAGKRLSLQLHEFKDETLFLARGSAVLQIGDPERFYKAREALSTEPTLTVLDLHEGSVVRVPPRTLHRIEAVSDCVFLEAACVFGAVSEDVVRFEDDFGRETLGHKEG